MAQQITYTDKVQGQANPAPEINKLTAVNANEIKTVVNTNALNVDEQAVTSAVIEPTIAAGAYTFPTTTGKVFAFSITESTTLTMPTLANSKGIVFTVHITGDFSLTLTDVTVLGDDYDGTIANRITFECYKLANGTQVNYATIQNLA